MDTGDEIDAGQERGTLERRHLAHADPGVGAAAVEDIEQPLGRIAERGLRILEGAARFGRDAIALGGEQVLEDACL